MSDSKQGFSTRSALLADCTTELSFSVVTFTCHSLLTVETLEFYGIDCSLNKRKSFACLSSFVRVYCSLHSLAERFEIFTTINIILVLCKLLQ